MVSSNIVIFLIFFAVGGILLGALVMYLIQDAVSSQRTAKNPSHTQPIPKPDEALLPTMNVSGAMQPDMETGSGEIENRGKVFSIAYSSEDGKMQVFMDGLWHLNTATMNESQRKRFEDTFHESANWLGYQLGDEPAQELQLPVKQTTKTTSFISDEIIPGIQPLVIPPARKMSIVEQVDEILQDILEDHGLTSKNIRLTEMPNKGVIVWAGNKFYEGIETVPDEEVKGFIKLAVKRWEDQATS
jgi:hypothetical protein